ncbi:50S ribosome-binding GTPase [Candidatus Micrarchaeota archaeon]|nr:50S ribosome-binding GTPase [Candidatus Micrarchaeota archaeon]
MSKYKKRISFGKSLGSRWRTFRELLRRCEIVIEVLDARDLQGTRLRDLERWAGRERLIKIANKVDLLDPDALASFDHNEYLPINSKAIHREKERQKIINAIIAKNKKMPRVVIFGYPNVGKSSIINLLAGRKAAHTSPVAGTTTNIQWIRLNPDILLMDSPGMFQEYETKEELLQKVAVNIDGLEDYEYYGVKLAKKCITDKRLRAWLEGYFDIKVEKSNAEQLIEKIAKRRNWLLKGGELNLIEACKTLLRAYSREAPKI